MPVRTREEVLQEFRVRGLSISAWARRHGFSLPLVYQVISGRKIGLRGQCHDISVALGMKQGVIGDVNDLPFEAAQVARDKNAKELNLLMHQATPQPGHQG